MCFRYTETRESDYLMHEKGFLSRSATYFDETAQKTLGIFPLPPKEFDRNLYVLTRPFFLVENPICDVRTCTATHLEIGHLIFRNGPRLRG